MFIFFADDVDDPLGVINHGNGRNQNAALLRDRPDPVITEMERSHVALALAVFNSDTGSLVRSEEHTSELQSQSNLVCRPLLGKKTLLRREYPVLFRVSPPYSRLQGSLLC